jgi:hypothetical protein
VGTAIFIGRIEQPMSLFGRSIHCRLYIAFVVGHSGTLIVTESSKTDPDE